MINDIMDRINVKTRTVGINFNAKGNAELAIWAPLINKVTVVLADHISKFELLKDNYGFWRAETSDIKPRSLYKISLNDKELLPDPASLSNS